jgi:ABC-2 type transport system permease protein
MSEGDLQHRGRALGQLVLCRIYEFLREPEALFWVFIFPVLLSVALGLAFREKAPDRIPIGIAGDAGDAGDNAAATRTAEALGRSPVLLPRRLSREAGREALRTGKISLLIEPGEGPGEGGAPPLFRFDETRPDSRIARLEAEDALQRAAGRKDAFAVRAERVTEKGSRYIDFLIPGLLGLNLMGTGIWSLAFSITTARNKKLLKRLIATPMRRSDYLFSHILSRIVFLIPEVIFLAGFGWLAFGVGVRGSLALFAAICLLAAMCFCGLGLLVASRVRTVEGASGLANLIMLPMWIFSGTFFSYSRFPEPMQAVVRLLPLTALNDALRGVMNEALTLAAVAPQLGIVLGWGVLSFVVAMAIFRWQ